MPTVANCLTWCQGCFREVFWARSCSSCTLQSFSLWWKTSFMVMLTTPLWWLLCHPLVRARVAVSGSMNLDLNNVSVWWNLCGMNLNASKTKTIIVSRSHTVHPLLTPFTLDGTELKESADLVISGVTFDAKIDDLREAPSLCFQCCSSEAWYYEKVLAGISWSVVPSEIFLELCRAGFGVLLSSVVLSCRLTP